MLLTELAHAAIVLMRKIDYLIRANIDIVEQGDKSFRVQALVNPVVDLNQDRRANDQGPYASSTSRLQLRYAASSRSSVAYSGPVSRISATSVEPHAPRSFAEPCRCGRTRQMPKGRGRG